MTLPIIGITPDRNDVATNIESEFFVRRNYCTAVAQAGGLPVIMPYQIALVDRYLDLVDGVVITGGMFDVHPELYGAAPREGAALALKEDRTAFELAILRGALERNLPLLGICGGMQLIAVALGAKLFQHLPADVGTQIEHKQIAPCNTPAHRIALAAGSHVRALLGSDALHVNSLHHQSVAAASASMRVGAVADDGVIEAIEVPGQRFCVGVQWHPEYFVNQGERGLFAGLVAAAGERRAPLAAAG